MKAAAILSLAALLAVGCGPKTVKLTYDELDTLLRCVVETDDQVERGNCVERLMPAE